MHAEHVDSTFWTFALLVMPGRNITASLLEGRKDMMKHMARTHNLTITSVEAAYYVNEKSADSD